MVDWKTKQPDGTPYIPTDQCSTTPTVAATTTTITDSPTAVCSLPEDRNWPDPIFCFDKDGNELNWESVEGFPAGSYCQQECAEHWVYDIGSATAGEYADVTTCECDETGDCNFSAKNVNKCIPGVCDINISNIVAEFSYGFDDPAADARNPFLHFYN